MSRKNSRAPEMMNFSNGFHRAVFFQFSVSNFIKAWILPPRVTSLSLDIFFITYPGAWSDMG